ncbi:hypothetical protein AYP82_08270 [Lactobacillus crispatus]|uniref:Uncharacterized protein n=1 Tax=Lactobacillus crispatus TaxID=47770 RepID=A0A854PQW0_9LACO|nr:DUF1796 family putative cysteine peptidase [Lactobacillus crispatus]OXC22981.1 hypothetical protein AYP82_08270 [Lactobacillus crispatus]OXC36840.1 hypothetical protein AYP91_09730 [Lactobacillus crispatus]
MSYDNLIQSEKYRNHYYDKKYRIFFFHDFNDHDPLKVQYPEIKEKYNRRIERFLNNIKQPTLFFRYINNERDSLDELNYINNNLDHIMSVLKKYNPHNEIIWIGNNGISSDKINIFNVEKDIDDVVCRTPLTSNANLYNFIQQLPVENKDYNIKRYEKKQKSKKINQIINKFTKFKLFRRQPYLHEKSFYWEDK